MVTSATMLNNRRPRVRNCPSDGTRRRERMSPASAGGGGGPPSSEAGPASAGFITTEAALYSSRWAAPGDGRGTLAPVRTRTAALLLVLATALPRLAALLHGRGAVLAS